MAISFSDKFHLLNVFQPAQIAQSDEYLVVAEACLAPWDQGAVGAAAIVGTACTTDRWQRLCHWHRLHRGMRNGIDKALTQTGGDLARDFSRLSIYENGLGALKLAYRRHQFPCTYD